MLNRRLLFLSVLLVSCIQAEKICNITVPLGTWFRNHTGPCDTVKGNLILDRLANVFGFKLYTAFGGLKSIEGCLYVKGFTGTTNLSFFGKLKSVVCTEKQASASNLTNVIEVVGPTLKTMGFNSLEKVEGPGRIILSFEEVQQSYVQMELNFYEPERGKKCFSIKEMLFLARHLQFQGKMYRPCDDITDPCFNLNPYNKETWQGTDDSYDDYDYSTQGPIVWNTPRTITWVTPRPHNLSGPVDSRTEQFTERTGDIDEIIRSITGGGSISRTSGSGDTLISVTRTEGFAGNSGKRRIARDTRSKEPDTATRNKPHRYTVLDIPNNCTTFVGPICLYGPLQFDEEEFRRFTNLTLIIGQVHMTGTLFDDLQTVFPKLQMIYPYESPAGFSDSCNCEVIPNPNDSMLVSTLAPRGESLQVLRVRINRFLTNLSLPSLESTRPLDLSSPISLTRGLSYIFTPGFFPEPIDDVCSHFPQFPRGDCGRFLSNADFKDLSDFLHPEQEYIQLATVLLTAIGVAFSVRAMILLQFSNATACLPYSRGFIIFAVFILTLSSLENCIVWQKMFNVDDNMRNTPQIFLEFDSPHLTHPFFQFIMTILVSTKYTSLLLVIFCYIDVIIFYRLKNLRLSRYFFLLATISAVLLCIYLHSQIFITIRGREPNYSREPRHVVYMPFIMNTASSDKFSEKIPSTKFMSFVYELLIFPFKSDNVQTFSFEEAMLEIHGNIFPDYSIITDICLIVVALVFCLLSRLKAIHPHNKFWVLIVLYFQLSINRLRYYIYSLLVDDYCLRKDIWIEGDDFYMGPYYTCYTRMFSYKAMEYKGDIIMDEYIWKIIEHILVIFPTVSYAATSFVCWRFARYASYLGPALQFREHRNETINNDDYDPANPSDCPPSYKKL